MCRRHPFQSNLRHRGRRVQSPNLTESDGRSCHPELFIDPCAVLFNALKFIKIKGYELY